MEMTGLCLICRDVLVNKSLKPSKLKRKLEKQSNKLSDNNFVFIQIHTCNSNMY